ncbi:MAG: hypothetical protein ACI8ZB_000862 [Desulforhopalus sp.]|jgi:hypothetical protein
MIDNTGNSTSAKNIIIKTPQPAEKAGNSAQQNSSALGGKESTKDQVNISYSSESISTYQYDMSLEQTAGDGLDLLRGLVLNIFKEQGLEYKIETSENQVDLETISPEEATELVADDGYFGVEKTAERIFNFAIGVAGGDLGRIDAIKEGVSNGFQEALEAFGGELPQISYDTLDAVMNKLDEWAGIETSPESLT